MNTYEYYSLFSKTFNEDYEMTTKDYDVLLRTRVPGVIKPLTTKYQKIATNMLSDKEKYKTAISPNLDDSDAIITIIYTLGMLK